VAIKRVTAALVLAGITIVVGADVASAGPPGLGRQAMHYGPAGKPDRAHKGGACDSP
jgi:hypothetical protein